MRLLTALIFTLLLITASYAGDAAPPISKDFKIAQFPNESWDGKWLQFLIRVDFPKMEGKTQEEAETIRKAYVTQSLRSGIQFLLNLATYDPGDFNILYDGKCDHLSDFPPKSWNMSELQVVEGKQQCDDAKGRAGDRANEMPVTGNTTSWTPPERDISGKSYDEILKFGNVIVQNHFPFAQGNGSSKYSPDTRFVDMNFGETTDGITSALYTLKDDKGHEVPVLSVSVPNGVVLNPDDRNLSVDVGNGGSFRNTIKMDGYSITYVIPSIEVGAIPGANGTATQMQIVVPNRKLVTLFQGSAPDISAAGMTQVQKLIQDKLKPFDLRLAATFQQGGLAGLVNDSQVIKGKTEKDTTYILKCTKSVDLQACKRIWAYMILAYTTFEPQRDKANPNLVTIKVSVPIKDLNNADSAEPYAKYMAK